ncbi:hypothetical protein CNBA4710 [Cryptococcus deneoformans B-3501A]|uniref:hypothetical protein n=1 Tax=Cryptococcus deneoformans (strain B-3501A) TaxID=283643 RepID=UPI000043027B|nr:hypothetical protein CNBA4710 [Cryptococcus neoformans var. neoformans B-3501A]EAL23126.1 hypothetical protein CNBA4710 [Cryptococcus neoformans var. neoformans B-3501A]
MAARLSISLSSSHIIPSIEFSHHTSAHQTSPFHPGPQGLINIYHSRPYYVTVARFISDRLLRDGGLKLSTREDFPTWNDSIMSALTYARVRYYIDLPSPQSTVECPMDSLGSSKSTETAPALERRPSSFPSSVPRNYSHYTTAATHMPLWSVTLAICTADTDIATWLGTMGSLARDLTAMELTVDKVLCALYLRSLPSRFDTFVTSVLSGTSNLSDSNLKSDVLRAAILNFYTAQKRGGSTQALPAQGPSVRYPCHICRAPNHWATDCPQENKKTSGQRRHRKPTASVSSISAAESLSSPSSIVLLQPVGPSLSSTHCSLNVPLEWILDNGAFESMTGDRSWLQDLHRMANGGSLTANEAGTAVFLNHRGAQIQLSHVLLAPGLRFNLLSTTGIMTAGVRVSMADGHSDFLYHGESVLRARLGNNSWVLGVCRPPCPPSSQLISLPAVIDPTSPPAFVRVSVRAVYNIVMRKDQKATKEISKRAARLTPSLSLPSLRRLLSDLSVGGRLVAGPSPLVCQGCVQGKITPPPFPSSDSRADSPLALVHTDICNGCPE